jgi:hypothetical protein
LAVPLVIDHWALDIDYCFFRRFRRDILSVSSSGDGAVIGRLDKSGDVSGLASRGTYEKIPEIGILSPKIGLVGPGARQAADAGR